MRYVDPTGKTLSDINIDNFVKDFGIDKIANFAGGIIGSVENTGKNVVNTTKGSAYLWIGSVAREGGRFVGSPLLTMVGENLAKEGLDNIKSHSVGLAVDTATIVAFEGVGKAMAPVLKPIVAELERKLYFLNVEINLVKKKIQVLELNSGKYPESASHIRDAVKNGYPEVLTIDRNMANQNRRNALKGINTKKGYDRDEYPFAFTEEGGSGSSVRYINPSDNRGSGSCIGAQCRKLPNGTKIKINIK